MAGRVAAVQEEGVEGARVVCLGAGGRAGRVAAAARCTKDGSRGKGDAWLRPHRRGGLVAWRCVCVVIDLLVQALDALPCARLLPGWC